MTKSIIIFGILSVLLFTSIFLFVSRANATNLEEEYPYLAKIPPELEGKIEVRYNWGKTTEPSEPGMGWELWYNYVIKNLSDQWINGVCQKNIVKYSDETTWEAGGGCSGSGGCRYGIPPGEIEKSRGAIRSSLMEEYDKIADFELIITGACFCKPPLAPTNPKVENVSTENELKLKISWTNPSDPSIEKIHLCRSNPFTYEPPPDRFTLTVGWHCQYLSQLKDIPENSSFVIDNYLSPSATSVIDNFKLVEGIEYYYVLMTESAPAQCQLGEIPERGFSNFSMLSEEATGIPRYPGTFSLREINEKLEWLLNKVETLQDEIAKIWGEIQALWEKLNWLIEKVLPPGLLEAQPGEKR